MDDTPDIVVARDDPGRPDVLAMLAESDAWYAANYPAESNHLVDAADLKRPEVAFFTARREGSLGVARWSGGRIGAAAPTARSSACT